MYICVCLDANWSIRFLLHLNIIKCMFNIFPGYYHTAFLQQHVGTWISFLSILNNLEYK